MNILCFRLMILYKNIVGLLDSSLPTKKFLLNLDTSSNSKEESIYQKNQ